jgi:hypothetical protein
VFSTNQKGAFCGGLDRAGSDPPRDRRVEAGCRRALGVHWAREYEFARVFGAIAA